MNINTDKAADKEQKHLNWLKYLLKFDFYLRQTEAKWSRHRGEELCLKMFCFSLKTE